MKALLCTQFGLPETLAVQEIPDPILASNQILIAVEACGVNFPDVLIIQNKYQFKPELPFAPGGEVAGKVIAFGDQVQNFQIGQPVLALCGWGGFAEKVAVDSDRVFPLPPGLSPEVAATTLYTYGTSYHALKDRANLQAGETLLVLGAAGGVGLAAVELGKLMGAKVIAAASSEEKLVLCREKGAELTINYETEDLKTRIKELTLGKGVDVVYDPVGGKFTESALRGMAWKGRYLVVGFANGEIPQIPMNLPLLKGCAILGVFWGEFSKLESKTSFQNIRQLVTWIQEGEIKQHIGRTYSLEEAPEALRAILDRKMLGKGVVVI
ncbi:NADPH:quinone oxidoreductase family protein [Algoriphagus sp.]|jgi:NADPH2:quinone reductase|uniref:NADPH:quinone oxidoreductase family protein n=1 Tax=Algoriphagus sp. TaxID=1872435 RepID=UPI0027227DA0|nr:NADPH:quinone oxidoreductase family protein [Algoriphagus sp.]MDO8966500.1 NADPH:quinone oxidoreductase family protein [Algoriphagus sp.]MDP3201946.1 NADPH:quinone oxidoreductase family protein [Algoriphagus sp.]